MPSENVRMNAVWDSGSPGKSRTRSSSHTFASATAASDRTIATPAEPTTPVSGFEYSTEATTGKAASQGVTTQYFGYSEQLEPNPPAVSGFDHNTDATTGRMAGESVTTQYFGNNPSFDE